MKIPCWLIRWAYVVLEVFEVFRVLVQVGQVSAENSLRRVDVQPRLQSARPARLTLQKSVLWQRDVLLVELRVVFGESVHLVLFVAGRARLKSQWNSYLFEICCSLRHE